MLVKADASQLEWRTKAYLAQCPIAIREIEELEWRPKEEDLHSQNKEAFKLPNRTIAKNFLYRMIFADAFSSRGFGGPAYAYANDADFRHVSTSVRFWEGVVTRFFDKYPAIYNHGVDSIRLAVENGELVNPSGRIYKFRPYTKKNGEQDWPRTKMLNSPVQGLAADFMTIARKIAWETIPPSEQILYQSTVHDDIELDVDNDPDLVYTICIGLEKAFTGIPQEFRKQFNAEVNVPLAGEVKIGWTLYEKDMTTFNRKDFDNIWRSILTKRPASW